MIQQHTFNLRSAGATIGILAALLTGGASFVAAEPPATAPTAQKDRSAASDADKVQSRDVRRASQLKSTIQKQNNDTKNQIIQKMGRTQPLPSESESKP